MVVAASVPRSRSPTYQADNGINIGDGFRTVPDVSERPTRRPVLPFTIPLT